MKQEVKIGQADYTVLILIRDTAGAAKTGLTNASAGIDVCYTRVETDNDVVLTAGAPVALATPALTDVHLDWGFLEVDATNAPGLYRLDIADGVFASGAWSAVVSLIATGIDPCQIEFVLVPESPYIGVDVKSIAGTAQTGRDVGASVLLSSGSGAGQLDFTSGVVKSNLAQILGTALTETAGLIAAGFKKFFNIATPTGTVNSLPDAVPGANLGLPTTNGTTVSQTVTLTAASIQAIWDALTSALTTVGSIGKKLADWVVGTIDTYTGNTKQTGDNYARLGAPAGASVSADVAAMKVDTAATLLDTGTDGVVVAAASKTGYTLSDAGVDAVFDRNSSLAISFETLINRTYEMINDKMNVTDANGIVALRNIGDIGNIATGSVTDNSVTTVRAELAWV